jgi:hypothetical protein
MKDRSGQDNNCPFRFKIAEVARAELPSAKLA